MTIVDTSTWIDHFRGRDTGLDQILEDGMALLHPFVLGELLLGGLSQKSEQALALQGLSTAPIAPAAEVAAFIGWANLAGTGIGYVDAHLLVSAKLIADGSLLTEDSKLRAQAERLDVALTVR